jgi:hypothetical protein
VAVLVAFTVRVDVWVPPAVSVTLVGFTSTVGPPGETVVDKFTTSAKLFTLVTVIVDVFEDPWTTLREAGLDVTVNPWTTKLPNIVPWWYGQ